MLQFRNVLCLATWRPRAGSVVLMIVLLGGALLGGCASSVESFEQRSAESAQATVMTEAKPTNVILFISDGCGPASFKLARDFARFNGMRETLYLDAIQVGAIRTSSANREITDSAAGATAFACGVKTNHQAVGVDADGAPAVSILERAESIGMATGVVATKSITDATPAAFTSHVADRYKNEPEIAVQQINGGFDLLFGGGYGSFVPEDQGGSRKDGRDLVAEARSKGYRVVTDLATWDATTTLPVLALMAEKHLAYEIDRDPAVQPTFPDIVSKAIELLSKDPDGFFLMAEGSLIDIAGHTNDAAAHVHDILAYDDGVKIALDFARRQGNTLVVSVSDHETGGLAVGRNYRWFPQTLARVDASQDVIGAEILEGEDAVRAIIERHYGFADLTDQEVERISNAKRGNELNGALANMLSERVSVDWTSFGHTGVDVNVYAFGPGSELFRGNHDNTRIGELLFDLLAR